MYAWYCLIPVHLCRVRDEDMVRLGVRMVDRPDGSSSWAPEDPEALATELAARHQEACLADAARRKKVVSET